MRAAARQLIDCDPWPNDDETTGPDVAKLALLRLMHLQQQVHRAAMVGADEAVVQLARSSVEACVLGVYSLHESNVVSQLKAGYLRAMRSMLAYLVDDGLVTKDVVDQAVSAMGGGANGPGVWAMAEQVDTVPDSAGAVSLYRRFYVPTSTFFVHANAASLLRHVGKDNHLSERPSLPWTRRSAVHIADACMGILSSAIAGREGKKSAMVEQYAHDHLALAYTPVAVAMTRGLRRSLRVSQLPVLVRTILDLRQYAASPQAASDAPQVRETRLRDGFDQLLGLLGLDLPDDIVRLLREDFVTRVLDAITEYADQAAQQVTPDH
ncbi:hypothetical protein [Streptomyces sp. NRRL S-146]|uniref:hypothetical protein n=1 Tax=Streptomyces sp. NRRL S-146 TaxID=1463884 RepID=UPI0004C963F4|nr:hypothetical protein [Streptomyces sp. NRRL S-146]